MTIFLISITIVSCKRDEKVDIDKTLLLFSVEEKKDKYPKEKIPFIQIPNGLARGVENEQ